ncbi:hypothetical protein SAMN02910384_00968 [Pseudobutyrivibrio sp. ACV-2]|uniref:DUF6472 family protein n=1 Tax=Pseudobutyrivibrio sp. ACV-2 TaxID=1520801 RepID=UPI0008983B6C|nr:DUF6472 family protein [Pseudobutyrivibrio sp. ACV-2]SEA17992.1 hypothetical protein SAMN02910384_00968 [Pseudobutyrivibrio sp. ACV-2]
MANVAKKKGQTACEYCNNFVWDEEDEQYYCEMDMDEDDYVRLVSGHYSECPYFVNGDEYKVVRHQM